MKYSLSLHKSQWVTIFFFLLFAVIAYQTFLIARPFLPGFLSAAMLGILFSPAHEWLLQKTKKPNETAALLTVGIILVTVIPLGLMAWLAISEAGVLQSTFGQLIDQYHTPESLERLVRPILNFFSDQHMDVKAIFLQFAENMVKQLKELAGDLPNHLLTTFFNGIVLVLTLFFVFRDGKKGAEVIFRFIPMGKANRQVLLKKIYDTFHAVVAGVFVTALTEGVLDLIVFLIAGVPLSLFLGLVIAFFSLFGASVLITIPVSFWVMNQDMGLGIFILIWGIVVSILTDNWLKPVLINTKVKMPFLLMLFSILGGLKVYGPIGIFLGPMMLTGFLCFCEIYEKQYTSRS